jgi:hypothetical protein
MNLKQQVESRKKEVNQILSQPKEKLPTLSGEHISFFWNEKDSLICWRIGWKPEEMVDPIKMIEVETDKFEWTDQNKTYQITVKKLVPPHNDWKEEIEVFVKVQNQKEVRYYKSIPNDLKKGNNNTPLFFLCYEVFPENNFKIIETPQSVIDQYLYNRGRIFECPKCKGKIIIKACGMTPLSIYGVTSSELCKCKKNK